MKGIVSFVLATGLGLSSLSAVESKTLSQNDKEFLFASNEVKTQVLSEQEMSETRGEFWGGVAAFVGGWAAEKILDKAWDYTKDKGWWEFKF